MAVLWIWNYMSIHRRLGGAQPGHRFVSFVRAYARSGCLVKLDLKLCWLLFSLFPFGLGKFSLFSFGLGNFRIPRCCNCERPAVLQRALACAIQHMATESCWKGCRCSLFLQGIPLAGLQAPPGTSPRANLQKTLHSTMIGCQAPQHHNALKLYQNRQNCIRIILKPLKLHENHFKIMNIASTSRPNHHKSFENWL